MKTLLTRILATLALVTLIAAPAAALEAPEQPLETPPAATELQLEPVEPLEVQVPADLPDRGHACVLPPQQQPDECICPLVFDPVCGCDDVTYSNSCFASCVVRTWEDGECS